MRTHRIAWWGLFVLLLAPACDKATSRSAPDARPSSILPISVADAFVELDQRRSAAVASRNLAALPLIFTSNSPAMRRVRASIVKLKHDRVTAREVTERLDLDVIQESSTAARVRERAVVDLKFFDENGNEVTQRGGPTVQTTIWILRFEGGQWRLHDAIVRESHAA